MKLQISTDYAVQILRYLHEKKDELHTAGSIAESIGISYHFFVQIANQMKKRGLLVSIQGRNGGYQLGRTAHDISFYDVFMCMEGELQISRRLQRNRFCDHDGVNYCKVHGFLHYLQDRMVEEMSNQSIADLT